MQAACKCIQFEVALIFPSISSFYLLILRIPLFSKYKVSILDYLDMEDEDAFFVEWDIPCPSYYSSTLVVGLGS